MARNIQGELGRLARPRLALERDATASEKSVDTRAAATITEIEVQVRRLVRPVCDRAETPRGWQLEVKRNAAPWPEIGESSAEDAIRL